MVLLFPALALGETIDDLVYRDDLYYKKFTDVPFTGDITEKTLQGTFRNGKKDGPWVQYYENGQLWEKGTYKDGNKEGPWVDYNRDGTVYKELTGTFRDGVNIE